MKESTTSITVAAISKVLTVMLMLCLASGSAGSCLSYGHSCWGGHGKRSTPLRHLFVPTGDEKRMDEWYFPKLIKYRNERPFEIPISYNKNDIKGTNIYDKVNHVGYQKYPPTDSDENAITSLRGSDSGDDATSDRTNQENNESDSEAIILPVDANLQWNSKWHLYQLLGEGNKKEWTG